MSEWMSIETAPRDGTTIIAYSPYAGVVVTSWGVGYTGVDGNKRGWREQDSDGVERVFWDYEGLEPCVPTHWMPLPEPPK